MNLIPDHQRLARRAAGVRYETRHFIDGQYVDPVARGRFTVVNPPPAHRCAKSAPALPPTSTWPSQPPSAASTRGSGAARRRASAWRSCRPTAGFWKQNVEKFSILDTLCMGKPITDMVTIDVPSAARNFAYFGELIDKIDGAVTSTAADAFHYILREPLGVVGCIVPWNSSR
jgi:gamma-glutamyl-gamma-aminobutyraldehyde dehydrogenase